MSEKARITRRSVTGTLTAAALALAAASAPAGAQRAAVIHATAGRQSLAFEVASIRPASGQPFGIERPVNGVVTTRGAELRRLIRWAYGVEPNLHDPLPEGGPAWIDRELFAIEARGPVDLTFADARLMMQTLLKERFNLRVHIEKREYPVYALVLNGSDGRLGPGMRRSALDCTAYSDTLARTGRMVAAREVSSDCQLRSGGTGAGSQVLRGRATMRELILPISRSPDVGRKVFDRTGLTGTFELEAEWVPARSGPGAPASTDVVSTFTALQEQLGLKLEPRRELLDVVVIDSVDPLIPN